MIAALDATADRRIDAWLSPVERIEALCDAGTVEWLHPDPRRVGVRGAVVAATGAVAGARVACYAQDASVRGGALSEAHANRILDVLRLAGSAGTPVVAFVESAGAALQDGGRALAGYGRIFRASVALAGRVPQISVITGAAAGGGSYAPALTDFVVMTERGRMFLTGPAVVSEVCGEDVSACELGGTHVHQRNGVCHIVAPSDGDAVLRVRELLAYLPRTEGAGTARAQARGGSAGDPARFVPRPARKVYDVRAVVEAIVDEGRITELSARWARNVVTALARIDGWAVGIVANQPRHLGGVLDSHGAAKAAAFVRTCDAYRLPLVVLVDTPGFLLGRRQESAGVIRHGAGLLHAFAAATVPRLTVVLRKAYGGAYIAMNSKDLGADLVFAWPEAEIGIMAATQAVSIVHRRAIESAADPAATRRRLADEYAQANLGAATAVATGLVDAVIPSRQTRSRLAGALGLLCRDGRHAR